MHRVPFDVFGSMKMTAVAALVGVTFASPIALKSDAFASVGHRLAGDKGHQVEVETVSAGGFTYDMPTTWGRLGASSVGAGNQDGAGTIVAAVCPSGDSGSACTGDVQVSFVNYRGGAGHELPLVSSIEDTFDAEFKVKLPGFTKVEASPKSAADGTRWLRYEFTYQSKGGLRREVLGAFRHTDGSGVIAVATGPDAALRKQASAIDRFLLGATEDVAEAAAAE
ncbi:MAG: hypothetical protein JWN72_1932 [Thermoleophilia bacterium]|nr:hypothetical protein [Thermoleophilia bacterium]